MKKIFYYLSYQDGRVNDIDYESWEDACLARDQHPERKSICISSMVKEVVLQEDVIATLESLKKAHEIMIAAIEEVINHK